MAIFFSLGLGAGGVVAPWFFGVLASNPDRVYMATGYYIAATLMIIGGLIGWFCGVDAENKSLE